MHAVMSGDIVDGADAVEMPHSLWRCAIVIVSRRAGGDGRRMELYISPDAQWSCQRIGYHTHSSTNSSISTSLVTELFYFHLCSMCNTNPSL